MLSLKPLSILVLIVLGVVFSCANVWYSASRSTIPLELQGKVTDKRRLLEKHPGIDDVCIVALDGERGFQIDADLYAVLEVGSSINKQAWAKIIEIDGNRVELDWSHDFRGMLTAMPLTMLVCVVLGVMAALRGDQGWRSE